MKGCSNGSLLVLPALSRKHQTSHTALRPALWFRDVNATHARRLSDATLPAAILESPIDIFLVEFSINGIEYVDVLLRRLRAFGGAGHG